VSYQRADVALVGCGEWLNLKKESVMKALILFVGWCILFVLCWPVALLAVIFFPLVWLISLPLRLIGITLEAVFALLRAALFLPARLLGARKS
jgi:hypothetical protein